MGVGVALRRTRRRCGAAVFAMGAGHNVLAAWLCVVAAWEWPQPRRINCAPLARDQNWSKVALWVSRSVTRPWSPRFLRRHVLGDVLTLKAPRAGLLLRPSDDGKYPHGKRICTTGSPSVSAVLSLDIRALGHDRPDSLQRFGEPATEAAGSNHREQCCRRLVAASVPLRRHATAERLGSPRLSAEDNGGDLDVWCWESALRPPRSVTTQSWRAQSRLAAKVRGLAENAGYAAVRGVMCEALTPSSRCQLPLSAASAAASRRSASS